MNNQQEVQLLEEVELLVTFQKFNFSEEVELLITHPMTDPTHTHLQLALTRLDVVLQRQIARQAAHWAQEEANQWPGLYLSPPQAMVLLQRPFPATPFPPLDDEQPYRTAIQQLDDRLAALPPGSRLADLHTTFTLDPFDQAVLLLCFAAAYDSRYAKVIGFLHDDLTQKRPSIALTLDLFAPDDRLARLAQFQPAAPLRQLLHLPPLENAPLTAQPLQLDETIFHWLLHGRYQTPHATLSLLPPCPPALLLPATAQVTAANQLFLLTGEDDWGMQTAVSHLAHPHPVLMLDLALVEDGGWETAVTHLLRDAQLIHSLPAIAHWERCLSDNAPPTPLLPPVFAHPTPLFILSRTPWRITSPATLPPRPIHHLPIPLPDAAQAEQLLTTLLAVHQTEQNGTRTNADERGFNRNASHPMPKNQAQSGESASQNSSPAPKTVSELDLAAVTSRFRLSSGQWRDVARTVQSETDGPITTAALFEAARRHSNPRLGELARKVPLRHGWDDLILPDDQRTALRELLEMVRQRPFVLDTWQLGRKMVASRGISALFSGPPGTGKTMAAAIISRELGLDLYKIDLSTVVSKYIGETEKNLERIFREAETSNAVLFFDEADAIFGKRAEVRDAHDRYANIEVSYLLQRMEAYDGVAILATNLKTNLDEAFLRRLHAIIHFPMPQPRERLQLWEMVRQTAVPQAENLHLPRFAERFELAGGNIRNIIVQAAYLAASNGQLLTTHHLLHATRRELQKMGRLVSEGDWRLEME